MLLAAATLAFSLQPHIGVQRSDLSWHIADPSHSPNVLSELKFEDMQSHRAGIAGTLSADVFDASLRLFLEGSGEIGRLQRGSASDADYQGDDRTDLVSLSKSTVRGDRESAYSAGIGLRYQLLPQKQDLALILGGYVREQDINIREGEQLVASPDVFPITSIDALTRNLRERLNSNYLAEWSGLWLAVQYRYHWQDWTLRLRHQSYRGQYYGEGRWNLRAEGPFPLQQPKSFSHNADSSGATWEIAAVYRVNDSLGFDVSWTVGEWDTDAGRTEVFFEDGTVGRTRFNEARHEASHFKMGLSYTFK